MQQSANPTISVPVNQPLTQAADPIQASPILPSTRQSGNTTLNKSGTQSTAAKRKLNNRNPGVGNQNSMAPTRAGAARSGQTGSLVQKYDPTGNRKDVGNKFIKNGARATGVRPATSKPTSYKQPLMRPTSSNRKVKNSYARISTNTEPSMMESIHTDRDGKEQMMFSPNQSQNLAFN